MGPEKTHEADQEFGLHLVAAEPLPLNNLHYLVVRTSRDNLWRLCGDKPFLLVVREDLSLEELEAERRRDSASIERLFADTPLTFFSYPSQLPSSLGDHFELMAGEEFLYVRPLSTVRAAKRN